MSDNVNELVDIMSNSYFASDNTDTALTAHMEIYAKAIIDAGYRIIPPIDRLEKRIDDPPCDNHGYPIWYVGKGTLELATAIHKLLLGGK